MEITETIRKPFEGPQKRRISKVGNAAIYLGFLTRKRSSVTKPFFGLVEGSSSRNLFLGFFSCEALMALLRSSATWKSQWSIHMGRHQINFRHRSQWNKSNLSSPETHHVRQSQPYALAVPHTLL